MLHLKDSLSKFTGTRQQRRKGGLRGDSKQLKGWLWVESTVYRLETSSNVHVLPFQRIVLVSFFFESFLTLCLHRIVVTFTEGGVKRERGGKQDGKSIGRSCELCHALGHAQRGQCALARTVGRSGHPQRSHAAL